MEQSKRYDNLAIQSKNISAQQDLTNFSRILPVPSNALRIPKKIFAPPQPPATAEGEESLEYNVRRRRKSLNYLSKSVRYFIGKFTYNIQKWACCWTWGEYTTPTIIRSFTSRSARLGWANKAIAGNWLCVIILFKAFLIEFPPLWPILIFFRIQ